MTTHILRVIMISKKALWKTDTQFNFQYPYQDEPIFENVEIEGEGENAFLRLSKKSNNNDNIQYNDLNKFILSDSKKITIDDNVAKLKSGIGVDINFPMTTPANYNLSDFSKIDVFNGYGKLKGIGLLAHAWWHLNESTGSSVTDSSGNGYDGILVNMENGNWVSCKLNNGLIFDGTNEYVNCGDIANFERTDSFSFECWVKTSNVSMDIMTKYAGGKGWIVYIASSGKLYVTLRNAAGTNEASRYSTSVVNIGSWVHIVVTYDGSSSNTGIKIYVNGSEDTDNTSGINNLTSSILTTSNVILAGRTGSASLNGCLDEVLIYESELSYSDVTFRYNGGMGTEILGYSTNHPFITNKAGFPFFSILTNFMETATKNNGTEIKYIISDDDGVTKYYWNGAIWDISDGSYSQSNLATEINDHLNLWSSNGIFKWYAIFDSNNGIDTPLLDNIHITSPSNYSTDDNLYIDTNDLSKIAPINIFNWISSIVESNLPANTFISIFVSNDGKNSWLKWSGDNWIISSNPQLRSEGNSINDYENNILYLPIGNGSLHIRLFLKTNNLSVTPSVSNINIISDAGYHSIGNYISTLYYPQGYYVGLLFKKITYEINLLNETSLKVYVKFLMEDAIESSESDYVHYNSGDGFEICGTMIQWKAIFTSSGKNTPILNYIEIIYQTLVDVLQNINNKINKFVSKPNANNQSILFPALPDNKPKKWISLREVVK